MASETWNEVDRSFGATLGLDDPTLARYDGFAVALVVADPANCT
jgi:hypothetical protein